jgi:hypothetical protein
VHTKSGADPRTGAQAPSEYNDNNNDDDDDELELEMPSLKRVDSKSKKAGAKKLGAVSTGSVPAKKQTHTAVAKKLRMDSFDSDFDDNDEESTGANVKISAASTGPNRGRQVAQAKPAAEGARKPAAASTTKQQSQQDDDDEGWSDFSDSDFQAPIAPKAAKAPAPAPEPATDRPAPRGMSLGRKPNASTSTTAPAATAASSRSASISTSSAPAAKLGGMKLGAKKLSVSPQNTASAPAHSGTSADDTEEQSLL